MSDLGAVRAAVVIAVPDIQQRWKEAFYIPVRNGAGKDAYSEAEDYVDEYPQFTPIRLADVLRAIGQKNEITVDEDGCFRMRDRDMSWEFVPNAMKARWPMTADNLDDCSEETIAFLHSILCP